MADKLSPARYAWRSRTVWRVISVVVIPFFLLSVAIGFWVSVVGLLYLVKPAIHLLLGALIRHNHRLFLPLDYTLNEEGPKCLPLCGSVISATALLLTLAGLVLNRVFSKNVETVKTVISCHDRFHKIEKELKEAISKAKSAGEEVDKAQRCFNERDSPLERNEKERVFYEANATKNKAAEEFKNIVFELMSFYYCEFQYYKRGLISTDTFSLWMRSLKVRLDADRNLKDAFVEANETLDDPLFKGFFEDLLCAQPSPLPAGEPDRQVRNASARELLRTIELISFQYRKKWQANYHVLAYVLALVDFDHAEYHPQQEAGALLKAPSAPAPTNAGGG